jgi:hypothetical protein
MEMGACATVDRGETMNRRASILSLRSLLAGEGGVLA